MADACVDGGDGAVQWAVCSGVCVDLRSDWQNCGSCGFTCTIGGNVLGLPPGSPGFCTYGMCSDGTTRFPPECRRFCGGDRGCQRCQTIRGAECTDLFQDPSNCGECGKVCPTTKPCCWANTCQVPDSGLPSPTPSNACL